MAADSPRQRTYNVPNKYDSPKQAPQRHHGGSLTGSTEEHDRNAEETDGVTLPDVRNISDQASVQFVDMLSAVDGKKDIVIQSELMPLLDNVTPMSFLRK